MINPGFGSKHPGLKAFGAWQSMPAAARHYLSCDGWCSVDEFHGGLGSYGISSRRLQELIALTTAQFPAASCSLRDSSMLIRLESPPRCPDQILKCQSFAVAPLFWDPVVGSISHYSVAFTVLSCSKFCVMSHINRGKLCETRHPKRDGRTTLLILFSPVISNVGLPQADG